MYSQTDKKPVGRQTRLRQPSASLDHDPITSNLRTSSVRSGSLIETLDSSPTTQTGTQKGEGRVSR